MLVESFRLAARLIEPSVVFCILILASIAATVVQRRRLALILQGATLVIIMLVGILPGGAWLAAPLERRFPVDPPLPEHVAGVIALGGTERLAQSEAWGRPTFSDPAPIVALLALGRRYPDAKLVFTGGSTVSKPGSMTESEVVRKFLDEVGADSGRVIYEERSRNTLENALFTRDLVRPNSRDTWILIGQAISLPRAVAVFRHAGWNIIPFPAGFLTSGRPRILGALHFSAGLALTSMALHEWGGLVVYRLMGYTDELLPR